MEATLNKLRTLSHWLLWIIALLSLALNLALINVLLNVRRQVGASAESAARAVANLRQSSIDYTVKIDQSLPVSFTVPFSSTFVVPISVTLPISTQVSIPLETPFGVLPLTVPIRTTIPVNLKPTVPIDLAIPISTTVPVDVDVPIHLALSDTALGESLLGVQVYLEDLATQLQTVPWARQNP
jgi:type II secretory pathway pseudopilin PulG